MAAKYRGFDVQYCIDGTDKSPAARRSKVYLIDGYTTFDSVPAILAIADRIGLENAHRVNVYSLVKTYDSDDDPTS
jgi:hypothetical protein